MKRCSPRVRLDDLESGPQKQVKGIAEHDLRAHLDELLGVIAFTVP